MKIIALAILMVVSLVGCASPEYERYAKAQTDIAVARHTAEAEKYKAMSEIAKSGDSAAKVAAVMAMAMGTGGSSQTVVQAPQASQALQWASILVPGLTQVAGMRYNYLGQKAASDNATALGVSTNSTFAAIAGKIQAPGAITTNNTNTATNISKTNTNTDNTSNTATNTETILSGTGTIGGGAYSTKETVLTGTGNIGSGSYSTTDRHDVFNDSHNVTTTDRHDTVTPAPVVVTPVVTNPTVITPVINTPPTVVTPVINTPPTVITPVVTTTAPTTP